MFSDLENALLLGSKRSEEAGDGIFHGMWISESYLIPDTVCTKPDCHLLTHQGVARHCLCLGKGAVDCNGLLYPVCRLLKTQQKCV
jgi:hypothetical protein